eukprot:scaffold21853_cov76-Amphora_coffeaeformis.AAC.1
MKVSLSLFLASVHVTCIDAWSTVDRQAVSRDAASASKFGRMSTPNSVLVAPKARGSPLWGASFD